MARKREQRIRRKARAQARVADQKIAELSKLKAIALAAIRYVGEIDARNPHEPWSIANRRDELRDVVHAFQGRPQRGERREPQAIRAAAPVVPLRPVVVEERLHTQPLPQRKETRMPNKGDREQLAQIVDVKRVELRNAAKKYGAEANKRVHNMRLVAALAEDLDAAAKAFSVAEANLRLCERRAEREAVGA